MLGVRHNPAGPLKRRFALIVSVRNGGAAWDEPR